MTKPIISSVLLTAALFVLNSNARAQSGVSVEDLKECRDPIVAFQNAAVEYFRHTARTCSDDPASDCGPSWLQAANEIAAQDPISYYWTGNGSCNGSGYTCFGKQSFDFVTNTPGLAEDVLSRAQQPPLIYVGGYPETNSDQADQCILRAWKKRTTITTRSDAHTSQSTPVSGSSELISATDSTVGAGSSAAGAGSASTTATDRKPQKVIASGQNASSCVTAVLDQPGLGYFKNSCAFNVEILFCNVNPKKGSYAEWHVCKSGGVPGGGMVSAKANDRSSVVQIKNAEWVLAFACKKPAIPAEVRFDSSKQQLIGMCR